jgi:hypothetical protein
MLKSRHTSAYSKKQRSLPSLLAALATLALLVPAAALAAPEEPPAEPQPPQLVFEPAGHDFGLRPLNWGPDQTIFTLRNDGSEEFQIGSPEIVGPGSGAFWTGNSNCYGTYLQPGQSCFAQVNFGPGDAVEYTAQLRVSVGSYSFAADLSGTGGRATFTPASNPTDFGVAKVGSAGTTREIEIANTGNMPGGVFIAVIAGGAIGSFQILDESCTGVQLVPDATCTVQVRFQPVSEGVKKAMLGLFGENEGPTSVVLSGVGTAPDPELAATGAIGAEAVPASRAPKRKPKPVGGKHRRSKRHQRRAALRSAARVLPYVGG